MSKEFAERVWELTGVELADIPWGRRDDACRHILAACRNLVVVGYDDYPDEDEDGNVFFSTFRKVDLSPDKQ